MNNFSGIGRLTKDPELSYTPSGSVAVCKFTLAINRKFKNANGEYEVDFLNCVAWRKTAEFIAQYFNKGQMMGVTGSVQIRPWEDKEGKKRYTTEIIVDGADFCGSKSGGDGNSRASEPATAAACDMPDTDLPF